MQSGNVIGTVYDPNEPDNPYIFYDNDVAAEPWRWQVMVFPIILALLLWATKPLWQDYAAQYLEFFRRPAEASHIVIDSRTAKGVRDACKGNSTGQISMALTNKSGVIVGQAVMTCAGAAELVKGN